MIKKGGLILLALLLGFGVFYLLKKNKHEIRKLTAKEGVRVQIPLMFNGFDLRQYHAHVAKIDKNDVLTTVLAPLGLPPQTINKMVDLKDTSFSLKKIIVGNKYALLSKKNTDTPVPLHFIYNINDLEYAVYTFINKDSVTFSKITRPQKTVERMIGSKIQGSLYETLDKFGVHDEMTTRLAEIFKWSVDFYKIQKDDEVKIIFTERYVEDKPIGIDLIKAIYLKHKGKDYYAIYFPSTQAYYKEDGMELKNLFLKAPVKFSRISSKFSKARFHPVSKIWKAHLGTDYAAPAGTPIISTADGVVLEAKYKVFNGNYVKVKHNQKYMTQYLHMSRIAKGIRPGVRVNQGQVIGYVGATGLATGPHVCYRFWKDGVQVNALKQDLVLSKPLDRRYKNAFMEIVRQFKPQLDSIPS